MVYVVNIYVFVFGQWLRIRLAADVSRVPCFFWYLSWFNISLCRAPTQGIDVLPWIPRTKTASDATIRMH